MGLGSQSLTGDLLKKLRLFFTYVYHGTTKHDGVPDIKREGGPNCTLFISVMGGIPGL